MSRKQWILAVAMLLNAVAVVTVPALGHDHWINHGRYLDPVTGQHCCDQNDCKEMTEADIGGVLTAAAGGLIVGGVSFLKGQLHKSEDGKWYRCANRCVFRPVEG